MCLFFLPLLLPLCFAYLLGKSMSRINYFDFGCKWWPKFVIESPIAFEEAKWVREKGRKVNIRTWKGLQLSVYEAERTNWIEYFLLENGEREREREREREKERKTWVNDAVSSYVCLPSVRVYFLCSYVSGKSVEVIRQVRDDPMCHWHLLPCLRRELHLLSLFSPLFSSLFSPLSLSLSLSLFSSFRPTHSTCH